MEKKEKKNAMVDYGKKRKKKSRYSSPDSRFEDKPRSVGAVTIVRGLATCLPLVLGSSSPPSRKHRRQEAQAITEPNAVLPITLLLVCLKTAAEAPSSGQSLHIRERDKTNLQRKKNIYIELFRQRLWGWGGGECSFLVLVLFNVFFYFLSSVLIKPVEKYLSFFFFLRQIYLAECRFGISDTRLFSAGLSPTFAEGLRRGFRFLFD